MAEAPATNSAPPVSRPPRRRAFVLRDYVYAAVTSAAIHVIGFVTVTLVLHIPIPGLRSIVSAPLSALVLTVGLAAMGKPLSLALVVVMSSFVYALISPVIAGFVLSAMVVAEVVNLVVFRGYTTARARQFTVTVYYTVMTPISTLFGAFLLGGEYRALLASWGILAGATAVVCLLCLVTTWLGERIVLELQRAGRIH